MGGGQGEREEEIKNLEGHVLTCHNKWSLVVEALGNFPYSVYCLCNKTGCCIKQIGKNIKGRVQISQKDKMFTILIKYSVKRKRLEKKICNKHEQSKLNSQTH